MSTPLVLVNSTSAVKNDAIPLDEDVKLDNTPLALVLSGKNTPNGKDLSLTVNRLQAASMSKMISSALTMGEKDAKEIPISFELQNYSPKTPHYAEHLFRAVVAYVNHYEGQMPVVPKRPLCSSDFTKCCEKVGDKWAASFIEEPEKTVPEFKFPTNVCKNVLVLDEKGKLTAKSDDPKKNNLKHELYQVFDSKQSFSRVEKQVQYPLVSYYLDLLHVSVKLDIKSLHDLVSAKLSSFIRLYPSELYYVALDETLNKEEREKQLASLHEGYILRMQEKTRKEQEERKKKETEAKKESESKKTKEKTA